MGWVPTPVFRFTAFVNISAAGFRFSILLFVPVRLRRFQAALDARLECLGLHETGLRPGMGDMKDITPVGS
jgi:hypothetical protein